MICTYEEPSADCSSLKSEVAGGTLGGLVCNTKRACSTVLQGAHRGAHTAGGAKPRGERQAGRHLNTQAMGAGLRAAYHAGVPGRRAEGGQRLHALRHAPLRTHTRVCWPVPAHLQGADYDLVGGCSLANALLESLDSSHCNPGSWPSSFTANGIEQPPCMCRLHERRRTWRVPI